VGQPADVNSNAQALQRAAMERILIEADEDPDSEAVVLNGRGYNYGPPPDVRFDPTVERAPADPQPQ
jgi:hypothetical protein